MRLRIVIIAFIVACGCAYWGYQESVLMAGAASTPEDISLKTLVQRGVGGNRHIRLKDFSFGDTLIFRERKRSNSWEKAWLPVVLPGTEDTAKEIHLLIVTDRLRGEDDWKKFEKEHESAVQGLLVNEVDDIGSDERNKLKESYPQTNFSKCLILHEGREPAGFLKLILLFGGAAFFFLVSVAALFLGRSS